LSTNQKATWREAAFATTSIEERNKSSSRVGTPADLNPDSVNTGQRDEHQGHPVQCP